MVCRGEDFWVPLRERRLALGFYSGCCEFLSAAGMMLWGVG